MQIQTKPLSQPKRDHLRRLLDSEGFLVLIEVLGAKAFEKECEIANSAVGGTSAYEEKAKITAVKAREIHSSIALLKELKSQTEEFTLFTAEPTAKP